MAGFGVGINVANNKQRGPLPADPRVMMREAIDLILKAWSAPEPFDWHGKVWQGEKWHIIPKPLTDIEVGIACSRTDTTLELTADKGFLPLMSWTPDGGAGARHDRHLHAAPPHKRGRGAGAQPRAGRPRRLCRELGRAGQARPARRRSQARLRPHAAHDSAGRQQSPISPSSS